jgi:hypothetical protein
MQHCVLWEDCHGKRGIKATGWIPREDVCKMKKTLSKQQWRVQGLCNRPSSEGLVVSNFEHEYAPNGNYTRWVYTPELDWYAVHDPAEGKKSVIYFIQIDDDGRDHVFDELIQPNCPDVTTAKVAFYEQCVAKGYADPLKIIIDPHRTDAVATWKFGTYTGEAMLHKYNAETPSIKDKDGGQLLFKTIETLRKAVQDGSGYRTLFINPIMCPGAVRGIKEYHYPTDSNNIITSDTPDKAWSDEVDPLRYWVMWKKQHSGSARVRVI